jgi:hypothetical protein
MARRTVIWHIGPTDPGTAFLADALAQSRPELEALGIDVPPTARGAWHDVEDRIWKHKGLSLLSTPVVAHAERGAVALRLNGLRDVEVHLVLLVRDLPSQVYAAWQDAVQHGSTTSLSKYAARVLDPERGHWQAEEFWAGRDLSTLLPRWTKAIHADRVHVVAAPSDPDALWTLFLAQAGVGDLPRPEVLVPPTLSAALEPERVLDITTRWAKLVAERGFDQHGSLVSAGLVPAAAASREEQFEAVAELLAATTSEIERRSAEVGRLRLENARLDRKRRKHKRRLAALAGSSAG